MPVTGCGVYAGRGAAAGAGALVSVDFFAAGFGAGAFFIPLLAGCFAVAFFAAGFLLFMGRTLAQRVANGQVSAPVPSPARPLTSGAGSALIGGPNHQHPTSPPVAGGPPGKERSVATKIVFCPPISKSIMD